MFQHPDALPLRVTIDQRAATGARSGGTLAFNDTATPLTSSATYTGAARDIGAAVTTPQRYGFFNAYAAADQNGTLRIECSNDGATWRRMTADADGAVTSAAPKILSVPVLTRYHRAVFVNGATAQGSFILNTSYSEA